MHENLPCYRKILLLIPVIFLCGQVTGQNLSYLPAQKINRNGAYQDKRTESLRVVLEKIKKEYQVTFGYQDRLVKGKSVNLVPWEGQDLDHILESILTPHGLEYKKLDDLHYVIKAKKTSKRKIRKLAKKNLNANLSLERENNSRAIEANSRLLKMLEKIVTGKVRSEEGEPLPGVNILIKGTGQGTITDVEGNYKIEAPDGDATTLVFSFVGYLTEEIVIGDRTIIDVQLLPDVSTLSEIVVVGYGTQSERNVTGAISKVDVDQIENTPNTNISQALRGRVAGVQFTSSGRPGQGGNILIRGTRSITASNDPLIVLDGIFFNGSLADINPNDIESMEVLKDASSAAIYGSRAANGVILITSKKGTSVKPTIRFNTFYGVQEWSEKVKLLSPERYIQKTLDFREQSGQEADPDNIENYLEAPEVLNFRNNNTIDPWDEISQNSSIQSYDLNISGRSDNVNYFISGSYVDEKGLIFNDNSRRIALRANIETKITEWLNFGVNTMFSDRDNSGIEPGTTGTHRLSPYAQLYRDDEKTNLKLFPVDDQLIVNPLFGAVNYDNEEVNNNLFTNLFAKVEIPFIEGLTYRINYSPNLRWRREYTFQPIYQEEGLNMLGSATKFQRRDFDWVLENIINYTRDFGEDHTVDLTLLYGRNHFGWEETEAEASNFFNDANGWNNLDIAEVQTVESNAQEQDGISSMARLNYRYNNRYLLTLTARRDGTSVFGENEKFAVFPSVALGWIASDESFMQNIRWVDLLKLRFSYGSVGNQAIDPYQTLDRSATGRYVFGDGSPTFTGIFPGAQANPNLKWETTTSANIAIDFEVFSQRLGGTIEYYNMTTEDLLLLRALPSMTGFDEVLTNLGETSNSGIELTINSTNLTKGKFSWNSNFVFSSNKNEIVKIYGSDIDGDGREDDDLGNRWFIGEPVQVEFDYVFDGIYQVGDEVPAGFQPGFVRAKDLNDDGEITPDDRQVIGQNEPQYRWGLTNEFTYGNFSLSFFINAMQGWISRYTALDPSSSSGNFPDRPANMIDAGWWTEENQSQTRPSLIYNNPLGMNFYVSRDFVRIQDVKFSYTFSDRFLSKLKLQNLELYLNARNLYTFTDWPGWDPESRSGFDDLGGFPTPRTFSAGLSISL